jgi:uracil-DNA glycosylase
MSPGTSPNGVTLPSEGIEAARAGLGLAEVAHLAATCRGCDLWARGTQTVFGQGSTDARLMLVGEQPGDEEDRAGSPFVGPAGRMLDRALADAGVDRERVFITNVVKHFKWRPSGRRRLHERPTRAEIRACGPWLEAELELVRPDALVLLGATAAQALLGPSFRLTEQRGASIPSALAPLVVATFHPSAVLRARDRESRERFYGQVVEDLRGVAGKLDGAASRQP